MALSVRGSSEWPSPEGRALVHSGSVSLDPASERERVQRAYPFLPRKDVISFFAVLAVIVVVDIVWAVDWWVYLIGPAALVIWEITKFRVRRNGDRFADKRA